MSTAIRILTFGDSLTQGGNPPYLNPMQYQYWMVRLLAERDPELNIDCHNHGIGGQIAFQIVERVPNALDPRRYRVLAAVPADIQFFVLMGGTNDAWRFSDWDEDLARDMQEDVIETLQRGVQAAQASREIETSENIPLEIILCSIPPVGNVPTIPKYMKQSIAVINSRLQDLARAEGVYFCDVHTAMSRDDGFADPECVITDGVHFTELGNQRCGEQIGLCIQRLLPDR